MLIDVADNERGGACRQPNAFHISAMSSVYVSSSRSFSRQQKKKINKKNDTQSAISPNIPIHNPHFDSVIITQLISLHKLNPQSAAKCSPQVSYLAILSRSTSCRRPCSEWCVWRKWAVSFDWWREPRAFGHCSSRWPCRCRPCSTSACCCSWSCSSLPFSACRSSCTWRRRAASTTSTTSRPLARAWSCSFR